MTSYFKVFKFSFKDQFKLIAIILGIDVILTVALTFYTLFSGTQKGALWMSFIVMFALISVLLTFIAWVLVIYKSLKQSRASSYRLLPVKSSALYLIQLLSAFLVMVIYIVTVFISFVGITVIAAMMNLDYKFSTFINTVYTMLSNASLNFYAFLTYSCLALLSSIMLMQLANFLSQYILDRLPFGKQGFVKIILYIVIAIIIIKITNFPYSDTTIFDYKYGIFTLGTILITGAINLFLFSRLESQKSII